MTFALYVHPDCWRHRNPPGHPERPERLEAIQRTLQQADLWERLARVEPPPLDPDALEAVHSQSLITRLRHLAQTGGGQLDPDTYVGAVSYTHLTLPTNREV